MTRTAPLAALAAAALLAASSGAALPGNGKLAYASGGRLYTVDPAGGARGDLGPGFWPAWSPDGTHIAFFDGSGIGVMNADGSGRERLHAGDDRQPVWSPDGTRIAFVTVKGDGGELNVVDAAGGTAHSVGGTGVQASWPPAWSPDGLQLAYTEDRAALDLAVVGADGTGHRVLSGGAGPDVAPAWSPDGTQIAFLHGAPGEMPALHVVGAGGGQARRLAQTSSGFITEPPAAPAWSPDGAEIAFTAVAITGYGRLGPIYSRDVDVADAEGTLERRLAVGALAPVWSPDARRIAFQRSGEIHVMNPDGTCETRIDGGSSPAWQPLPGAPPAALLRCADLELTAANDHGVVGLAGAETFRITVRNLENEPATGVQFRATSPAEGSFVSVATDRGTCAISEDPQSFGSLFCDLGTLKVGESGVITVIARADITGVVSSHASVGANEPDGEQANNTRDLTFEALPCTIVGERYGGRILGTPEGDSICGLWGPDFILGFDGADFIDAGMGPDRVFPGPGPDEVNLRAGADFVDARDRQRDTITCGGERDIVLADPVDSTTDDCEFVFRPRIARCKTLGTPHSDRLVGSKESDSVCALSGNDEIHLLDGADAVDAGGGNDTLNGGRGRDLLIAGDGYDTVFARDGARDRIRCGAQYDVVFADKLDLVSRSCEHVVRR